LISESLLLPHQQPDPQFIANAKFPLAFKTNKQVYYVGMNNQPIIKTILVLWFFLCIVPGDCLLLDCAGENASACHEKASAVLCCGDDADTCIPQTDSHCPNCCTLCANHLVMPLFQNDSFVFTTPTSLVKIPLFTHVDSVFQTIIYHPPRLTA